jgi:hypothetical protein
MKSKLSFLALALVGALFFSAQASALTLATFEDPTVGFPGETVLEYSGGVLNAGSFADEIVVDSSIGLFSNASLVINGGAGLTISSVQMVGGSVQGQLSGGSFSLITDIDANGLMAGDAILTATFDSALLVFGSVIALELTDNLSFSGAVTEGLGDLTNEIFAFSSVNLSNPMAFINFNQYDEMIIGDFTTSASFTSSASVAPVPVPAALPLMFSGLLGGLIFGRKKAKA